MKMFTKIIPVAALALGLAPLGKADTVIAVTGGTPTFTNVNQIDINKNGTPFFDGTTNSDDNIGTANCSIGALLTGLTAINSANCIDANNRATNQQLLTGNGIYSYLNDGTGANVTSWTVDSAFGGGSIRLEMELAGARANNILEMRRVGDNALLATFLGGDASGSNKAVVGLNAGDDYYFRFIRPGGGGTDVRTDVSASRFALFKVGQSRGGSTTDMTINSYVLGIEDGNDWDYQDMVITANVVPEPASVIVLSSAVLGTLALVRRRRAQK